MKFFSTEHKMLAVILFCSLAASLFAACTLPAGNTPATTSAATTSSESSVAETISTIETTIEISIDYDEEDAEIISLNGDSASSDSDSVAIDGSVITIKSKGTYRISGTLNDGYIVVDAGDSDDVTLVFEGASISSSDYAALYCLNADNVYIILEDGTENLLANKGSFESKDDNSVDGAIFAKTDITINGTGSLKVESEDHGIVGKDDVAISGGTIEINAASDGIQANDSVVIQEAVIYIYCGKDGIQSDNEDDYSKGYVFISSGEITIEAGDDGITASSSLQIDGGIIDIVDSYEGLEGQNIVLNGGNIIVSSSDDAINAVSASSSGEMFGDDGSTLVINGGEIYLMTGGDGVDSNGTFDMTGGNLVVMGPEMGANGSLDVNGSATITGGTVVMAGASGMATNFTSATQGAILLSVGNQSEGSEIKVTDSSGNVILSADSVSSYQTILVSSPDMTKGSSYTITAGNYEETITLEDYIYGSGMEFGGPGGGGGPGFGFPG